MSQLAPIRNKGSESVMAPNDAESVESHLPESNWRPALYEGANDPFSLGEADVQNIPTSQNVSICLTFVG